MKKLLSVLTSCLLAGALLTGCGDSSSGDQSMAKATVGMITGLNMSEQQINATIKSINGAELDYNVVYYDSLNTMQSGLEAGSIDEMSTYKSVADYLIARHPEFEISDKHKLKLALQDKFCCAVKSENKALLDEINGALKSMTDDGTLESLTKKYITELKSDEEPEAIELPKFDGAETIKVAVTGDLPPLDLIRADGTPAGFNTAVLAEIGKRISRNFELVSVDSTARAAALASDRVQLVFWVRIPHSTDLFPVAFDRPEGVDVSTEYFVDEIVHVGKKK